MTTDDDSELMVRYARGDMGAFEVLYRRHRAPLYRYLAHHTRHTEVANDLFQEVWSKIIASRDRYEPRANFRAFLYRIAHNCFIDHCRRASARTESPELEEWERAVPAPEEERPDALAEQAQTMARYRAALAALPAEQRDVFLLYEESGLSLEEIASISAVGTETAKSRLRYAVAKLRAALGASADSSRLSPLVVTRAAPLGEPGA
jgi:RNA polymerase sigma-70 factor (ECF subfamily)